MVLEDEACSYFSQNFNCAQAVFATYAKRLGLDVNTALKIGTPFGGGIAHKGQICRALSGGLMVIGPAGGVSTDNQSRGQAGMLYPHRSVPEQIY